MSLEQPSGLMAIGAHLHPCEATSSSSMATAGYDPCEGRFQ
jgi:hypothetical protein